MDILKCESKNFNKNSLMANYGVSVNVLGGTGVGKTQLINIMTTLDAKRKIINFIGETNSSLTEKQFIFSSEYNTNNLIVFGVQPKSNNMYLSWDLMSRKINIAVSKVISKYGNKEEKIEFLKDEVNKSLENIFVKQCKNTEAQFKFLEETELKKTIEEISDVIKEIGILKNITSIYRTARNNLEINQGKKGSQKLLSLIEENLNEYFTKDESNLLPKIHERVNEKLDEILKKRFPNESKTKDGYFYREIYIDNMTEDDKNFLKSFVSSNDLEDRQLSLELLCEKIVIRLPLAEMIKDIINKKEEYKKQFIDKNGNYIICFEDNRGFFHKEMDEKENKEFAEELFKKESDVIVLIMPMFGDTNKNKNFELFKEILSNYGRKVPIIIVQNKVDLFIENLNTDALNVDVDIFGEYNEKDLSDDEIIKKVDEKSKNNFELIEQVVDKRVKRNISFCSCYLKPNNLNKNLKQKYNPIGVIEKIFNEIVKNNKEKKERLNFKLDFGSEDIELKINYEKLDEVMKKKIFNSDDKEIGKEIFTNILRPIKQNLDENEGITPHGNGYNALVRRIIRGNGYDSIIDELWNKNCKSFYINFPNKLYTFATKENIQDILLQCIYIEGGTFKNNSEKEEFFQHIKEELIFSDFTINILYKNLYFKAEKMYGYSFKEKFNNFIKVSQEGLTNGYSKIYRDGFIELVKNAFYRATT